MKFFLELGTNVKPAQEGFFFLKYTSLFHLTLFQGGVWVPSHLANMNSKIKRMSLWLSGTLLVLPLMKQITPSLYFSKNDLTYKSFFKVQILNDSNM